RQHHQFGFEVIGEGDAVIDAQLIHLFTTILMELGLKNIQIAVNSIGDLPERRQYKSLLQQYYRSRITKLCQNCKRRLKKNPLRLLDCKEEKCMQVRADAPQLIDHLSEGCHNHFREVLEYLEELGLPYVLNPYLVRGFDYYTRTVFEIVREGDERAQNVLAGGGRYDRLVEMIGGRATPAVGGSSGIERLIQAMQDKGIKIEAKNQPAIFLAQLSALGRRKSLKLFDDLRKANIAVAESFGKASMKSQLKIADKLGVRFSLILGQKEALDGNVILREMDSGAQETIPLGKIISEIKKRLQR
ncbi:MAG: histidine--tRNA ligase, partial [Parcubacteria group bacterium]|nr:histidine--tRNA ligase [Parcubacteria group bacterium]